MKIGVIIQARMSSERYPSKVLTEVNKKPLLSYIIDRLRFSCKYQNIVIATSLEKSDNPIENFCLENGILFFRGDLENVSLRMLEASKINDFDGFVRVNGDSPLVDPHIINKAVSFFKDSDYDLVTNTYPRTFPVGQSVEVIRSKTFEKVVELMTLPEEFEHVTKFFYNNPSEFNIYNFKNNQNLSDYRFVVDTPEDMVFFKNIITNMDTDHINYHLDDLIKLALELHGNV